MTAPAPPLPRDTPPKTRRRATKKDPQEGVPSGPSVTDDPLGDPGTGTGGTGGTGTPDSPPPSLSGRQSARKPPLQRRLEEFLATPALAYSFMGDQWAAELITTRTPIMAEAWYDLSTKNPAVKRVLERLLEGSAWGGVVLSTMAVALPLAQHHGLVPGADPFSALYPPVAAQDGSAPRRGPIVPPPPSGPTQGAGGPPPPDAPIYQDGSPPGVVTVKPGVNQHAA